MKNRPKTTWIIVSGARLALLGLALWVIHSAWERSPSQLRRDISIQDVQRIFPDASSIGHPDAHGFHPVYSDFGDRLGSVALSFPEGEPIFGYSGPSLLIIGLDRDRRIAGVQVLSSGDTFEHVEQVRREVGFLRGFIGWKPWEEVFPKVEAVSGSTLTSLAIAESIQKKLTGRSDSLKFAGPLSDDELKTQFPDGAKFERNEPRKDWTRVLDDDGSILGYLVLTSPYADSVRGYRGPTELLVQLDPDQETIRTVSIRQSYDTPDYVDRVEEDEDYLKSLTRFTRSQWVSVSFEDAGIEGVSGATQTSYAIAEGLRSRFKADQAEIEKSKVSGFRILSVCVILMVGLGTVLSFHSLRGHTGVRWIWSLAIIIGFGIGFGQLFSLGLLVGWARYGIPWLAQPALILVVLAACLVPPLTRRQVYCHHLCPHGLLQERLGKIGFKKLRIPARLHQWLQLLPAVLLGLIFIAAVVFPEMDLAQWEPFDAWALIGTVSVSVLIAVASLFLSLFIPQAYCKYGCPSGAMLGWLRFKGAKDGFGTPERIVATLVFTMALWVWAPDWLKAAAREDKPFTLVSGAAFGTSWSVKLRDEVRASDGLQVLIQNEIDRIESEFSTWNPKSATSLFNSAQTTFEMEQPEELMFLLQKALELSRLTEGAYDITLGPLIDAWGYGPQSGAQTEPEPSKIQQLLSRVGYQNLELNPLENTLRKKIPELEIDLGSVLQGYAADRLDLLLKQGGFQEYLIDVGGELLARGQWKVAVESPVETGKAFETILLTDQALAVSGNYRLNHLISPNTGYPVEAGLKLAAVMAETCLEADARATALMVSGMEKALELADRQGWTTLFVGAGFQVRKSENWRRIGLPRN